MTYLLDANVFIQAKNLHYGFDFCPARVDRRTGTGQTDHFLGTESGVEVSTTSNVREERDDS